ncbi:MAG: hypothetical protein HQK88_15930 [Nitrospirae bacterium]|nr:hypothetical protein [Nitrospirota bacterium]MBF0536349.1 hypothetical protein [Nitrospirota bacterium]MBF0618290.1 hypothetical protein [Nitrospirota bacterium]
MSRKLNLTIRRYNSFEEMKADEYKYWQQQPAHVRMDVVEELTREAFFGLRDLPPNESRLQRTLCHIKR